MSPFFAFTKLGGLSRFSGVFPFRLRSLGAYFVIREDVGRKRKGLLPYLRGYYYRDFASRSQDKTGFFPSLFSIRFLLSFEKV